MARQAGILEPNRPYSISYTPRTVRKKIRTRNGTSCSTSRSYSYHPLASDYQYALPWYIHFTPRGTSALHILPIRNMATPRSLSLGLWDLTIWGPRRAPACSWSPFWPARGEGGGGETRAGSWEGDHRLWQSHVKWGCSQDPEQQLHSRRHRVHGEKLCAGGEHRVRHGGSNFARVCLVKTFHFISHSVHFARTRPRPECDFS